MDRASPGTTSRSALEPGAPPDGRGVLGTVAARARWARPPVGGGRRRRGRRRRCTRGGSCLPPVPVTRERWTVSPNGRSGRTHPRCLDWTSPSSAPSRLTTQTIVDCVEVERRPLSRGVARERAEPRLVTRGAGELRGHGQTRSLPLDAERAGAEGLGRERVWPHPRVLGREREPALGLARDPLRVDVGRRDVRPGGCPEARGSVVVARWARTVGKCMSRHGDRGLPRFGGAPRSMERGRGGRADGQSPVGSSRPSR